MLEESAEILWFLLALLNLLTEKTFTVFQKGLQLLVFLFQSLNLFLVLAFFVLHWDNRCYTHTRLSVGCWYVRSTPSSWCILEIWLVQHVDERCRWAASMRLIPWCVIQIRLLLLLLMGSLSHWGYAETASANYLRFLEIRGLSFSARCDIASTIWNQVSVSCILYERASSRVLLLLLLHRKTLCH